MTSDDPAGAPQPPRGYVRFSAKVARSICQRLAAGETQRSICGDPAMPSTATLRVWARERPAFAKIFARARALGHRDLEGRPSAWCPVTAHEVVTRVSEGESVTAISRDPAMPSMGTIFYWRSSNSEFAEALRVARETVAERLSDMGWEMALEATPQTAYLTRVRLGQLRWTAALLGPRTHGRLKPTAPPEPPEVMTYLFRHFNIEEHPQTGQHRVVVYTPDPETNLPVRTSEGPWKNPLGPLEVMDPGMEASRRYLEARRNAPDD